MGLSHVHRPGGVTVVVLILVTQIGNTFGGLVIFEAIRGSINRGF